MKRYLLIFIIGILLVSCENIYPKKLFGEILIIFPLNVNSKGVLSVETAKESLSEYSVLVFDPSSSSKPYATNVNANETMAKISVPVNNNYSVIVLAYGKTNGWQGNCLLAAGEQKNVSVVSEKTTTVTISLEVVDLSFSVITPPEQGMGSSIKLKIEGNTGISSLSVGKFVCGFYDPTSETPNTSIGACGIMPIDPKFSGTPTEPFSNEFTETLKFNVTSTTTKISIIGYNLSIVEGSLDYLFGSNFIGYGCCPSSMDSNFILDFSPAPKMIGINLIIYWGQNY